MDWKSAVGNGKTKLLAVDWDVLLYDLDTLSEAGSVAIDEAGRCADDAVVEDTPVTTVDG
jgi:hypothetical protein